VSTTETIEREEWLILLAMIGDIRAEVEDIHELLRDEDDDEETEEDT